MKYFILLCDGMADLPVPQFSGKTPMEIAVKPTMDFLSKASVTGMVQTVPDGVEPGSGPANMSVMGYDPRRFYTGRSPLEALSLGIEMSSTDMIFRMNLVSLDRKGQDYETSDMLDYSAGEISTAEAQELVLFLRDAFEKEDIHLYPGKSYRHILLWENGPGNTILTPPHDISGRNIREYLPKGEGSERIYAMMKASADILSDHPINLRRRAAGKNTADSIWLWGQGTKPGMCDFFETFGKKGAVISAVDLIFGLGRAAGLDLIEVPGATGNLDTNFAGKAIAAVQAYDDGYDYIYLHVEAPDECGHHGDAAGKKESIERISEEILSPVYTALESRRKATGEDYRILVLPDHPTPVTTRAHSGESVPFFLYDSACPRVTDIKAFSEEEARKTGTFFASGPELFTYFIS